MDAAGVFTATSVNRPDARIIRQPAILPAPGQADQRVSLLSCWMILPAHSFESEHHPVHHSQFEYSLLSVLD